MLHVGAGRRNAQNVINPTSISRFLALNNNGANGTSVFTDTSQGAHALSAIPGGTPPTWTNTLPPSGLTTSALFDAVHQQAVTATPSADFNLAGQAKTIEIFLNTTVSSQIAAFAYGAGADFTTIAYRMVLGGTCSFSYSKGDANAAQISGGAFSTNTWYHVAIVWDLTNVSLYVAGTRIGQSAVPPTNVSPDKLYLGWDGVSGTGWGGKLASCRISNGVLYSGATITPPPLPLAP